MRRAVVCALVAIATRAYAEDELAQARRLEASLEYEKALAIVDRVIARGGADPAHVVELHMFAGRLAAGLDRAALAEDHFARVLALVPTATLPAGTSPKLTAPFEAARVRARPLVVSPTVAHGLVTLEAELDSLGLVHGIAVHVVEHGVHRDIVERNALRVVVPETATIVEISALDSDGNRVWVGPPPHAPEPPPTTITAPVVVHHGTPFYARWSTYAIAGGVVLAGAGVCAWRLDVAQTDFDELKQGPHDYSKLTEVATRGDRWALAANIGFGVAGAALATSLIVALVHHDDEPAVLVAPTPTGATALLRF